VGGFGVDGRRERARSCCRVVPRSGDGMDRRRRGSARGEDARRGAARREGGRTRGSPGVGCRREGGCRMVVGVGVARRGDGRREAGRRWVEAGLRSRYLFLRSRTCCSQFMCSSSGSQGKFRQGKKVTKKS
jgi:hypothetical protein